MCIAIVSTAHPDYELIVLSNRDEFLHRPTAPATWWDPPNTHVLGGRDLHRAVQGTWLGMTKQGRFAVLTNFREEHTDDAVGKMSRGAIVNSFLTIPADSGETPEEWAAGLVAEHGVKGVGGFSLMFGWGKKGLAIISNRTPDVDGLIWLATTRGETHGLSNSHYGDTSWPKVTHGEEMLASVIRESSNAGEAEDAFTDRLFGILSTDTLPRRHLGEDWDGYIEQLRNSVFIPVIGREATQGRSSSQVASGSRDRDEKVAKEQEEQQRKEEEVSSGTYGTEKQTVILVRHDGSVTYIERTLYDSQGKACTGKDRDCRFDFDIHG
ncbi:DUF833-domain-containing protein [Eremomyces bilateralis CBS 781.70]|uniref:DUF833-domain-containing protein n=1 Tax=Eremomyces bilateralis CBS 781.70 TaxID=1392243 RepID=A0A6G1G9U9_9PEZI|nr:DUF833-domain-containing protein [Eremomyces bilateralis CBS 781.70]KAF1814855.1 DUF833-domain-containing protein [Eremomyces bilateralis CBS 781.70]